MKRSLLLTLISLKVEIMKSHFFFKLRNPSDFSDEGGGKWGGLEGPAVDRLFLREIENVRAEGLQCIVGLLYKPPLLPQYSYSRQFSYNLVDLYINYRLPKLDFLPFLKANDYVKQ